MGIAPPRLILAKSETGTGMGRGAEGAYAVAVAMGANDTGRTADGDSAPVILHSSTAMVPYDLLPFFGVNVPFDTAALSNSLTERYHDRLGIHTHYKDTTDDPTNKRDSPVVSNDPIL
jgi:hypothetical protein